MEFLTITYAGSESKHLHEPQRNTGLQVETGQPAVSLSQGGDTVDCRRLGRKTSAEETQRQGSLPYSLLCAHISVPRVGGQGLLWGLGGDVTLLGRDTATALSLASQLGHSGSCKDALSRTRAAELH